jgi:hypothetical protein
MERADQRQNKSSAFFGMNVALTKSKQGLNYWPERKTGLHPVTISIGFIFILARNWMAPSRAFKFFIMTTDGPTHRRDV